MVRLYKPSILEIEAKRGKKVERDINISLTTKDLKVEGNILTLDYEFIVKYSEDTFVKIAGVIVGQGPEEELKKFEEFWRENKKLKEELFINLYNFLMMSLFNKITELADIIGLPAPVNLPLIRPKQVEKEKSEEKEE